MKRLKNTLETLRRVKYIRSSLRVCPKCGRSNLKLDNSVGLGFLPAIYICKDCGYRGHLIIEADVENQKKKKID